MELVTEVLNNQFVLYIPVALVLVVAAFVFTFGFRSAEQPQFDKLSSLGEDRKPVGKKRKTKEKKSTANGHATHVSEVKQSPSKEAKKSPVKDTESTRQQKEKKHTLKAGEKRPIRVKETIDDIKNKKNNMKTSGDKEMAVDLDDGNWETVLTKVDKKNRKSQESPSPPKKEKGSKKVNIEELIYAPTDNKKTTKEDINKGLQEKAKKEKSDAVKEEKKADVQQVVLVAAVEQEKADDTKPKKKVKKAKEDVVDIVEKEVVEKKEKATKEASPKKEESPKKEAAPSKQDIATLKEPVKKEKKRPTPSELFLAGEKDTDTLPAKVAFDELGDLWVDAKAAKKTKKKSRKDY